MDATLPERVRAIVEDAGFEAGYLEWLIGEDPVRFRLTITGDVQACRVLVAQRLAGAPVVIDHARFSERELNALLDRITEQADQLCMLGIDLSVATPEEDCVSLEYFARDQAAADTLLRERFGPALRPIWTGASSIADEPQPFATWVCDGTQLTVFYPLYLNGERPGHCTAEENPDRVVVHLTVQAPQGFRTLIGGYRPSHATVTLATPLGDRAVIDGADGVPRPEWTTAESS
jgi:hypothetical protein